MCLPLPMHELFGLCLVSTMHQSAQRVMIDGNERLKATTLKLQSAENLLQNCLLDHFLQAPHPIILQEVSNLSHQSRLYVTEFKCITIIPGPGLLLCIM